MKKILFRNVKVFLSLFLSLILIFSCSVSVFAAENEQSDSIDEIMDAMSQEHILTSEELGELTLSTSTSVLDASAFYDTLNSLDMNAFGQMDFTIPSSIESEMVLAMQYTAMHKNLESLGYGSGSVLLIPEMEVGYSNDIKASFEVVYGDLSGKYNETASLPDGWDMRSIMHAAQDKRDGYAADIKDTDAYNVVSKAIATSQSVTKAITTLRTPELKSAISLQQMLTESTGSLNGKWTDKAEDGHTAVQKIYKANAGSTYNEDYQVLFDEAKGDISAWLELNKGGQLPSWITDIANGAFSDLFKKASNNP